MQAMGVEGIQQLVERLAGGLATMVLCAAA
jgi:hypothetical protein